MMWRQRYLEEFHLSSEEMHELLVISLCNWEGRRRDCDFTAIELSLQQNPIQLPIHPSTYTPLLINIPLLKKTLHV